MAGFIPQAYQEGQGIEFGITHDLDTASSKFKLSQKITTIQGRFNSLLGFLEGVTLGNNLRLKVYEQPIDISFEEKLKFILFLKKQYFSWGARYTKTFHQKSKAFVAHQELWSCRDLTSAKYDEISHLLSFKRDKLHHVLLLLKTYYEERYYAMALQYIHALFVRLIDIRKQKKAGSMSASARKVARAAIQDELLEWLEKYKTS